MVEKINDLGSIGVANESDAVKRNRSPQGEVTRNDEHLDIEQGLSSSDNAKSRTLVLVQALIPARLVSFFNKYEATFVVLASFCTSVCLINCTKWTYKFEKFQFPMFVTMLHAISCYLVAYVFLTRNWIPCTHDSLSLKTQFHKIAPFSLFGAASVGSGNLALFYLYPSFHEMIQNTTPFWTILVMSTLGGIKYNRWSYISMIPVCGGGVLCGLGEVNLHFMGIIISILCVVFRALRVLIIWDNLS